MLSYLYYRLYRFFHFIEMHLTPEGIRIPEYLAMFAIVFLVIFNLITLDVFIYSQYGIHLILKSLPISSFFVLIVFSIMYVLLMRKKKYVLIIEKYAGESMRMKALSVTLSSLYVLLTVVLLIIVTS